VELNTIASSFAGLSSSVSSLHRHLALRWPALRSSLWDRRTQPKRLVISDALPPNPAVTVIAEALARAHREYGSAEAAVLFVVQPGERNVVDQALLSQALFDAHGVQVRGAINRLCGL
jgi:glutathione synthase